MTFQSRSPITAYSFFRVLKNGAAVHEETSEMQMRSSSCRPSTSWTSEVECNFLYSTALVPRYWKFLCECKGQNPHIVLDVAVAQALWFIFLPLLIIQMLARTSLSKTLFAQHMLTGPTQGHLAQQTQRISCSRSRIDSTPTIHPLLSLRFPPTATPTLSSPVYAPLSFTLFFNPSHSLIVSTARTRS